jgi:superfamily I DNA/RNA helicase
MANDIAPTTEQKAIIEAFSRELGAPALGRRHLIVNAGAGTGKTTALRMTSDAARRASGLYIAFNKSVADSASQAFGSNVECRTSHSLAYRHIARSDEYAPLLEKIRSGPQRDERQRIAQDFNMASRAIAVNERRNSGVQSRTVGGFQLVSIALSVIERFCQTAAREPSAAHIVAPRNFVPADFEQYRTKVWESVESLVRALWADLMDPHGKYMKFNHSTYLKLYQLSKPVLHYDFILLDEAQDTAPVTEDIVMRQSDHSLLVLVGDPSQAIYGFTGARDSMSRFEKSGVSYESLTLSESWRFGSDIAGAANTLLEQTERDMRIVGRGPEGEVLHHLSPEIHETPSVYVCRSNFDVIEAALEAVSNGMRVDTSSVDLSEVESFLDGAVELKAGKRTKRGGLGAYARWSEFELDYEDGVPMTEGQRVGMMLLDKYTTESACKEKIALIQGASASGRSADVKVITIHKAKGGQWLDVSVRYDSAFRKVRDEADSKQLWWEVADPHLAYVAVTRAIEALDPGRLWPLVEYGIVCDPSSLLPRARGLVDTLNNAERRDLLDSNTVDKRAAFGKSRDGIIATILTSLGVRDAVKATTPFVALMRDILLAERRALRAEQRNASKEQDLPDAGRGVSVHSPEEAAGEPSLP